MRYLLVLITITVMVGCKAPGVGDLEERVDELETTAAYDDSDLVDRVDYVEDEVIILDERVTALELGGIAEVPDIQPPVDASQPATPQPETLPPEEPVEVNMEDIPGLLDSLTSMESAVYDSIGVLDSTVEELEMAMDSLSMENDSLRVQLEDLTETVQSLSYTVENMRYTGSTSSSSRGGTSSGSTGGRGGTSSSTGTGTTSSGGR